jgi:hypothetical protein
VEIYLYSPIYLYDVDRDYFTFVVFTAVSENTGPARRA